MNYRGIFLTLIIAKIYERIFFARSEEVLKRVSLLQAGSRSERGSLDDLFLVKGCIDHAKYLNSPLFLTLYDFKQCFDALWLEDCIISLWKLGLRDEALSIMFKMNEKAVVTVNTPMGKSDEFTKDRIVKQGTVSGPPMCSTSTAEFAALNKAKGFPIGSSSINTTILVDDIANVNNATDDVILSHNLMILFSKIKRLPLSGSKCHILPINVPHSCTVPVLRVDEIMMDVVDNAVYLGLVHNSKGNNVDMLNDRLMKAKTCMVSILAMCSEVTLGIFVIQSLLLSYAMVFVPTMLYGAQVWTRLTGEDLRRVTSLQLNFLKRTLRVPRSTCNCVILMELGILPIQHAIDLLKLSFLYHILSLSVDDPVRKMYKQQLLFEHECNWGNEMRDIREKYELTQLDDEVQRMSKDSWKIIIKKAVHQHATRSLNKQKATKSKLLSYPDVDELATQAYFSELNAEHARVLFQVRVRILDVKELRGYKYSGMDNSCRSCGDNTYTETLSHILCECTGLVTDRVNDGDEFSTDLEVLKRVSTRAKEFLDLTS